MKHKKKLSKSSEPNPLPLLPLKRRTSSKKVKKPLKKILLKNSQRGQKLTRSSFFESLGHIKGKNFAKNLVKLARKNERREEFLVIDWMLHTVFVCWIFCTFGTLKKGEQVNLGNSISNRDIVYWLRKMSFNTTFVE